MSSLDPTPITPKTTAGLPDAPLEEGVNSLPELSAHIAVLSRKNAKPSKSAAAITTTERAKP